MAKFCYNCGSKLDDDSCFCAECGAAAVQQTPVAPPTPVAQPVVMAGASNGDIYADAISAEQRNGLVKWHGRASLAMALCVITLIVSVICAFQLDRNYLTTHNYVEEFYEGFILGSYSAGTIYNDFEVYSDLRMWLTILAAVIMVIAIILFFIALGIRLKSMVTKAQAEFALRLSASSINLSCIAMSSVVVFFLIVNSLDEMMYDLFNVPMILYAVCLVISIVIGIGLNIYRKKSRSR